MRLYFLILLLFIAFIECNKLPSVTTDHVVINNSLHTVEIVNFNGGTKSVINLSAEETVTKYYEGRDISPIPNESYDSIKIVFDSIKNLVFYPGEFSKPRHFGWGENWELSGETISERKNISAYTYTYTITESDFILADSL